MAMAAMIKMIATTISNSMSEKPSCLRIFELVISFADGPAAGKPQGLIFPYLRERQSASFLRKLFIPQRESEFMLITLQAATKSLAQGRDK